MTTLFHTSHKSLHATHLLDALRPGDGPPCADPGSDEKHLGQYRVLECIGSGGMGKVYLAEHRLMGRRVAIKVMSAELLTDPESCARFRQEVRLVAQLCHPHIVLAHDADESDGVHYFVMEYVEGADLGHIVAQFGALPIPFVCECIRQTALGLQHAHEHGLVHCDIKPSNLLLRGGMTAVYNYLGRIAGESSTEQPLVKILDFGLARLAGKAGAHVAQPALVGSALCGTPDYMAPELGRDSSTVDIRCDLYSLGCTFSFLLTGQVPYPGGSWSEKLIRHHYDPAVPVCHTRPGVPDDIEAIVSRLMAKDPIDRFATPGEVAKAIELWQCEQGPATRPDTRTRPRRNRIETSSRDSVMVPTPPERTSDSQIPPASALPAVAPPRRSPLLWIVAACLAVAAGLGSAWLVTNPVMGKSISSIQAWARKASGQAGFRIGRREAIYSRLELAVAEAVDGDTIWVQGDGPFVLHGISCYDKSLTIKADEGFHPIFEQFPELPAMSWTPLFWANHDLTLEGLILREPSKEKHTGASRVAHLVYGEGAALRLINCELHARSGQALVVARQSPSILIENCTLEAGGAALCVEVRDHDPTTISLIRSKLKACDRDTSPVVIWSSSSSRAPCELELNESELTGARLLALNGLNSPVSIHSHKTAFQFQEALLSLNPAESNAELRSQFQWTGFNNRFASTTHWILSRTPGEPIRNLQEWRRSLACTETDSIEESVVRTSNAVPGAN